MFTLYVAWSGQVKTEGHIWHLQISPDNTKYRQEFVFGERGLYTDTMLILEFASVSHNIPNTSALH